MKEDQPVCTLNGEPLTEEQKKEDEDYNDENDDEFWGYKRADNCCKCMKKGPDQKCIDDCQMIVNGRARLTSSEVGYYLDFGFDKNGLPKGCPGFDDFFKDYRKTAQKEEAQIELLKVGKIGVDGLVNCGKQESIKDEKTKNPIWKTVELFAQKESLSIWHNEFLKAYGKMMVNGNSNKSLKKQVMPMAHGCKCFQNRLDFWSTGKKENNESLKVGRTYTVASAKACLDKCIEQDGCNEFLFKEKPKKCEMYSKLIHSPNTIQRNGSRFVVYGNMVNCNDNEIAKICKVFM